jgi:hypothetical protein
LPEAFWAEDADTTDQAITTGAITGALLAADSGRAAVLVQADLAVLAAADLVLVLAAVQADLEEAAEALAAAEAAAAGN